MPSSEDRSVWARHFKNGLLIYPRRYPFCNLGDYIQSLAARQYFQTIDTFLDRESMDQYSGAPLKAILNGWFMHEPEHWPPSPEILPHFVSFHINSVAREGMLRPESVSYLRRWAPIGCRDHGTVGLLKAAGVDAYFSGCLTLTLGRCVPRHELASGVLFVDPHAANIRRMADLGRYANVYLRNRSTVDAIATKLYGDLTWKSRLKASGFYSCYRSLFTDELMVYATYVKQVVPSSDVTSEEQAFGMAERLLELYSRASLVVTSRIHCALPCLGIGTPVLYVEDVHQPETSWCRLDGLRELLNVVRHHGDRLEWGEKGSRISFESRIENPKAHLSLAQSLAASCEAFANAR